jgi:nucleotide-binding universal stress UspA family protein
MAYATLMVHVDLDTASDARIRLAYGLADRFESALIGVAGCAPRSPIVAEGAAMDPTLMKRDLDDMAAQLKRRGDQFLAIAKKGSRKIEWRSDLDFPTDVISHEARAADLVIIGREPVSGDAYRSLNPGNVLLNTGRPVLVTPSGLNTLRAQRVMIAWKETRESRRAVVDALPFLHDAEKVFIVEVCEEGEEEKAQHHLRDVMKFLERHRITTSAGVMLHVVGSATDELLRIIQEEQIDLLVAGAYGHSRLGEWAFGGVTRDLLARSPICCLFSH